MSNNLDLSAFGHGDEGVIQTGFFQDVPFSEYIKIPAISKSTLFSAEKCLRWFKHKLDEKQKEKTTVDKAHFSLGRAVHTRTFEPELFDSLFTVIPVINKRTNKGKAQYANFVTDALSAGKDIITEAELEQIVGMSDSLAGHPLAGNMLAGGMGEVTVINRCERYNLNRKCRLDWFIDNNLVVDLKTTGRLASKDAVLKQVFDLGYYVQAGMYLDIVSKQLGTYTESLGFAFIFIETTAPFLIGIYPVEREMIRIGTRKYEQLMFNVMRCIEHDYWPHYNNDNDVILEFKPWMLAQINESFAGSYWEE